MMHGMHDGFMFFNLFWLVLLLAVGILAGLAGIAIKRLSGSPRTTSLSENSPLPGKAPTGGKLPEEFKKSGAQILEQLDWDIRFLEKQRLEANVPAERRRLDEELKVKREEYQTVVERLQ